VGEETIHLNIDKASKVLVTWSAINGPGIDGPGIYLSVISFPKVQRVYVTAMHVKYDYTEEIHD